MSLMEDYNAWRKSNFSTELDMSTYPYEKSNFLITGGAGFIGSNLVNFLLENGAKKVRVLDNLSNGYKKNIQDYLSNPAFEFIEGDIRDLETCNKAVDGMDFISHQAALGSVPRSINDPVTTNEVNISGFLNMLIAAKENTSTKRFIYAASSSTYGDHPDLPKLEGKEGKPLSPYAVTKAVNEMYADVFSKVYGFHTIGLRYFNIFGPRQNPDNPYAAVIPIFCAAFLNDETPTINGDGFTSRDFTYIDNAVQANVRAFFAEGIEKHEIYNVACGEQTTLNEIIELLNDITGKSIIPKHGPERPGDVKHSKASIEKIKKDLGYMPEVYFKEALSKVVKWYMQEID